MHLFPKLRFVILDEISGYSEMSWDVYENYILDALERQKMDWVYTPIMLSASNSRHFDVIRALKCSPFSNLWYLDLSYMGWQEDSQFRFLELPLQNLRILKLRGSRLTDRVFPGICQAAASQLWSLDIRDNLFTDAIIPDIVNHFLLPQIDMGIPNFAWNLHEYIYEDCPAYSQFSLDIQLASIRPDSQEGFIQYLQERGHFLRRGIQFLDEHDPLAQKTGLTQLYISGNQFSHEELDPILNGNNRLQVLDIGTVIEKKTHRTITGHPHSAHFLRRYTGTRLEVVRLHHSVVTYCQTTYGVDVNRHCWDPRHLHIDEKLAKEESSAGDGFSPVHNHRIKSLTLTGIPSHSTGFILDRLLDFLWECGEQERQINVAKAQSPQTRQSPIILPGLRTLILEFVPEMKFRQKAYPSSSSSVSGDRDADTFLCKSMDDFSFFSSFASGASGVTNATSALTARKAGMNYTPNKTETGQRKTTQRKKGVAQQEEVEKFDIVEELKFFRASEEGKKWTGKLQLVLPGSQSND